MKKRIVILWFVILALLFTYCSHDKSYSFVTKADYNSVTHSLKVDYNNYPDTSLLEIIAFSNIRKSGYGLLLNLENSYSKSELDTLKRKFQKLDINAVHSFNISVNDSVPRNIQVAIEGSQFFWILEKEQSHWKGNPLGEIISKLETITNNKALLVETKDLKK